MRVRALSYLDDPASSGKTRPGCVSFFGLSHPPPTYTDAHDGMLLSRPD